MESRAKVLGHSVHQMLIVFPLGLLATAAIFDLLHVITSGIGWARASYYLIPAGFIGGIIAAVFGVIDFVAIPKRTRAPMALRFDRVPTSRSVTQWFWLRRIVR